jgi:hypothetical protein
MTMALLKEVVGEDVYRKDLTAVCMSRYVKICTTGVTLTYGIWLVIENHYKVFHISLRKQRVEALATAVLPIVATHNINTLYGRYDAICKELYRRSLQVVTTLLNATDILVISRCHVDAIARKCMLELTTHIISLNW